MARIVTALQSGNDYDVEKLCQLLNVSRRTIFRDIKEIENVGVPIEFDNEANSYKINSDFYLKPVNLSLQEALSLLILVQKCGPNMPVPFRNSAVLGSLKIQSNLPQKMREYCKNTLKTISLKHPPQSPQEDLDEIFATMQDCIHKKHPVKITYKSLYEMAEITTTIEPYKLHFDHKAWYIIGKSRLHNSVRTFKLKRIIAYEPLKIKFTGGEKFDHETYFGRAWSMIKEGKLYNVVLKFSAKVAHNVSEVKWHETQKSYFNNDGTVTMEFRVDGLGEIMWWILGYGDQVKILKPKKLRTMVVNAATNVITINESLTE